MRSIGSEQSTRHTASARTDQAAFLRVFQGEATVETDKLDLVLPLLGLYSELLAMRHNHEIDERHQRRIRSVLEDIELHREEIFPRNLHIRAGSMVRRGGRNPRANGARRPSTSVQVLQKRWAAKEAKDSRKDHMVGTIRQLEKDVTYDLFGDLVERVERKVDMMVNSQQNSSRSASHQSSPEARVLRQITRLNVSPKFGSTHSLR